MTDTIIGVAAVITAVTVLITAGIKIYKMMKRIDAAIGVDNHGLTANDRLEAKLGDVSSRMTKVEYQLFPNGGGSLVDKVNRTENSVIEVKAEIGVVKTLLHTLVDNHAGTPAPTISSDQVPAPETKPRLRKTTSKS